MALLDRVFPRNSVVAEAEKILKDEIQQRDDYIEVLRESMADLELALDDQGWERLANAFGDNELSRAFLVKVSRLCRVSAVANPLIKRGLNVRQAYVFGQGIEISARESDVDEILQKFVNDPSNQRSLFGSQASEELERANGTDGNIFLACFTTPKTGRVEIRSLPFDEITDVIRNPEDRDEPWYYERSWTEVSVEGERTTRKIYYPDLLYRPAPSKRLRAIHGYEVNWNAPIWHISVNRLDGWKFGIGDAFAALAWSRSYKEFLEDWALLVRALSRFAWRSKSKRGSRAQKIRDRLVRQEVINPDTGETMRAGQAVIMDDESDIEAIPKTGAVIDSDSGKPLAAMVAAALEISIVVLLGDPGQTGARAVAETLDEPTIRMAQKRQELWGEAYRAIVSYVLDANVRAGKLPGSELYDLEMRKFRTEIKAPAGKTDSDMRSLDIIWPELGSDSVKDRVASVVQAHSTGKMPGQVVLRLLLEALGVDDPDAIVESMMDENGNFKDPELNATQAAVRAFRRGEDPAGTLSGGEGEREEDEPAETE